MKRLGIVSDTHLSETGRRALPPQLMERFRDVDFILHAGDFTSRRALEDLQALAPVVGVRGNNDPAHLELPWTRRVTVEGVVIGLCHGDRSPAGWAKPLDLYPGNQATAAVALDCFEFEEDVNCIIFGHSHNPMCQWHAVGDRKILLFNPGSPTDKRLGPLYGCGILEIEGSTLKAIPYQW